MDGRIMESTLQMVFKEVENKVQKNINTWWVLTTKMKEGKTVHKARLVDRGFKEYSINMETDTKMCAPEMLKLCISKIMQERWIVKSIDMKTAYLQGDNIKRMVYLKPS